MKQSIMKHINTYINEKLRLTNKPQYTIQPKTKYELRKIIIERIENEGPTCDLNDIDVSQITDMTDLFNKPIFKDFNGDISQWNVSNVTNMDSMFYKCKAFDGDISMWDVSNVTNMGFMFYGCKKFNCDLSMWNVSNVEYMQYTFNGCKKFNCDISKWRVSNVKDMYGAFYDCPTQPDWYNDK